MKEKTLNDFGNEVAKEKGFIDFGEMWMDGIDAPVFDEIALRYANYVKAIALQEGFAKGCELQKGVCAEHAETELPEEYGEEYIYPVDKNSILNAPNAENPYTK